MDLRIVPKNPITGHVDPGTRLLFEARISNYSAWEDFLTIDFRQIVLNNRYISGYIPLDLPSITSHNTTVLPLDEDGVYIREFSVVVPQRASTGQYWFRTHAARAALRLPGCNPLPWGDCSQKTAVPNVLEEVNFDYNFSVFSPFNDNFAPRPEVEDNFVPDDLLGRNYLTKVQRLIYSNEEI